ncbi:unnamed protein product [Rhizoctonia solani]|uniref:BTB domain-containing protein n=1 Tax=Rhizoctonia solani TaxID=456999 RepID=A0A8H2XBS7_9AGAM|nr:unnamed protein product [Rhizoctonia solani]
MATTLSRQTSASDLNSQYRAAAGEAVPPSPKSPTFLKGHSLKSLQIAAWLGRGTGQAPQSPGLKTMQISDPQPTNSYDAAARAPGGMGNGATVVRMPQDVHTSPFPRSETPNEKGEPIDELPVIDIRAPIPVPPSNSTPPLVINRRESPVPRRDSPIMRQEPLIPGRASPAPSGLRSLHTSKSYSQLHSPPRVAPLPLNLASSRQPLLRAALKPPSPTKSTSSNGQFLPLLPPPRQAPIPVKDASSTSPLPPFHPVLLSAVPTRPVVPSQVIVQLETSTLTQRTTVATLAARPSRLADYLQALVPVVGNNEVSLDPTFSSLFAAHLAQAGIVPQIQHPQNGPIHIFLDRPSAPYTHILTYLRSSGSAPGVLPRAASLALSTEPTRVEALCELRDEAKFLELTELVELCDKELRARAPRLRSTVSSSSLRDFKFGNGPDGSTPRTSGLDGLDSRLKDFKFGTPGVDSLREEEGEGEHAVEVPPIVYEKRGSHAGMVTTVPPRNAQTVNSKVGPRLLRSPPSHSRMRTISEVQYVSSGDGRLWI